MFRRVAPLFTLALLMLLVACRETPDYSARSTKEPRHDVLHAGGGKALADAELRKRGSFWTPAVQAQMDQQDADAERLRRTPMYSRVPAPLREKWIDCWSVRCDAFACLEVGARDRACNACDLKSRQMGRMECEYGPDDVMPAPRVTEKDGRSRILTDEEWRALAKGDR